jgi:hypothetical protein
MNIDTLRWDAPVPVAESGETDRQFLVDRFAYLAFN